MKLPKSFSRVLGRITNADDCGTEWFSLMVKSPLKAVLIALLSHYPEVKEPDDDNTRFWMELREEYRENECIEYIGQLADLIFKVIIAEQRDPPYEQRMDWILARVHKAILEKRYLPTTGEYSWGKEERQRKLKKEEEERLKWEQDKKNSTE